MRSVPSNGGKRNINFGHTVQAFFQQDGLPFADLISAEKIEATFEQHAKPLGSIYTFPLVLWAFLSQVLRDGKEAACQSAVARIIAHLTRLGCATPSADTGDYCRARAKLPQAALKELTCDLADQAEAQAETGWLFQGRRHAKLIDGFTFLMPDTPKNQKQYPQHTAQKPGIGFPIARVVGIISLATGSLMAAALGPFKGKETGETALLRNLMSFFCKGDLVVADRYFCCYWLVAMLMTLGVDVCFRQVEGRQGTFKKGKRIGKNDYRMIWFRPARSSWMPKAVYDLLPPSIEVRRLKYCVNTPGRKQESFVILTTMIDTEGDRGATYDEVAMLYHFRWNAELDIRNIKTFLNLHHVRCKSPEMVHREFWVSLLAHNLIRVTIATAASLHQVPPREISFVSACQFVLASWQELPHILDEAERLRYCLKMLEQITKCRVANRPGRLEPRVVKKRRDRYRLMMQPRNELRKRLKTGDNKFED